MSTLLNRQFNIRMLFIFAGGFILYEGFHNWLRGRILEHPGIILIHTVAYLMAFSLFFLALIDDNRLEKIEVYPLLVLIFTLFYSIYIISNIVYLGVYRTDAMALSHYSALRFVDEFTNGVIFNPYTVDLQEGLRLFSVDLDYITFTEKGDIITSFNYPALHFLHFVPFIKIGWNDMRWVVLLFEIATILIIYIKSNLELRPLIVILLFAGSDLTINFTAGCVTDFLWILPLVVSAFYLDKNLLFAGFLFGISCATKQIPWILAPFLIIWVWHSKQYLIINRVRRIVVFILATVIGFILPNMYFIFNDFEAWREGVFTPLYGNLVFLSQGLSLFTQAGLFNVQKTFYLIVTICFIGVLLINYLVYFKKLKYTVWMYPGFIMWASYRGLQNYFIVWIPLIAVALVLWYNQREIKDEIDY